LSLFEFESAELSLSGDESVEAEALRARARLLRGDTKGAEERAERLLAQHPDDTGSLNLLALASLERGDRGRALTFLRRAAGASPFDAETEALLRKLEVSEHDPSP
jgi:Flp pilus assembly protein TadD